MMAALSMSTTAAALFAPKKASWLAVVSHTDPRYGGLSTAVPRAGQDLNASGRFEMSLAAFCAPGEQFRPAGYDDAHQSFWPLSRAEWIVSPALRRRFDDMVQASDGLHLHGLWEASTAVGSRAALRQGRPYVLSAHGMLEPWALANKGWKKRIYAALIERKTVARANCLHALTEAEAAQYRAFGAEGPIAVIPNAVAVPEGLSSTRFFDTYPLLEGKRLLLYLGRLHPKKGLPHLLAAWARVAPKHPEAHLVLAGPDSEGTMESLQHTVTNEGLHDRVTFTGMLGAELKWSALVAAEVFVLPSFSEGLSMGVLEALGAGVPVVVTRNCNMPEVAELGAGWVVEPTAPELEATLEQVLQQSPEENQQMGESGRRLIASRYEPSCVAAQMAEVYDFVLYGRTPRQMKLQQRQEGGRPWHE